MRSRHVFLYYGVGAALVASLAYDPDGGLSTLLGGVQMLQAVLAIGAAHLARKMLMDYPEADWRTLYRHAAYGSRGAGLALIAGAIVFVGLLMLFATRAHAGELPAGFNKYGSILKAEQERVWSSHPAPWVLAGLVEQESCPSLKSKSCWNPAARLKSSREEGAGMGQITRAYRADGTERFDALADLRRDHAGDLAELSWANVYSRPDLQLRALVIKSQDSSRPFRNAQAMLEFGDAAYNGGIGGVQKERRACQMTAGCDPGQWFGHVERHCLKSRQILYGGRNACDINRDHVHNVTLVRPQKYKTVWAEL